MLSWYYLSQFCQIKKTSNSIHISRDLGLCWSRSPFEPRLRSVLKDEDGSLVCGLLRHDMGSTCFNLAHMPSYCYIYQLHITIRTKQWALLRVNVWNHLLLIFWITSNDKEIVLHFKSEILTEHYSKWGWLNICSLLLNIVKCCYFIRFVMLLLRTVSGLIPYAVLVFLILWELQLQLGEKMHLFTMLTVWKSKVR